MFQRILILFSCLVISCSAHAQADTSHLRISLLTCGTGDEVWSTFGHTAIRVTDSVKGTDMAYNYGTFAFSDDFALQFMRGKLLYYLSFYPYENFLEEYLDEKRSVEEQVLMLDGIKKQELYVFLQENAKEENKYYKYDFFFDNCATRIRDVFPKSLDKDFKFGETIAAKERLTYREIINQYYYRKHWERFGINLLLGKPIDKQMSNEDIMFLPDYLKDGIGNATVDGKKIAGESVPVLPGSAKKPAGLNEPFIVMLIVALLTIAGLLIKPLKLLGNIMSFLVLFVSGLLGFLILVMWFGTDHQGCADNFNLLWALPINLVFAFTRKTKTYYPALAIFLLLLALVLHILKIQELPLLELFPLLLALLFIYGKSFRNRIKA
jgi:hypothetical protein